MPFLRRANTPTARETFLVAALLAVGVTADDINDAQTANQPDFLKVLGDESADLQAAQTAATEAKTKLSSLTATITAAGFKVEDLANPDAFKAAVKTKVSGELSELSASRGIAAVTQTPADSAGGKTMTRSEFEQLSHERRNEYMRSGGKLTD